MDDNDWPYVEPDDRYTPECRLCGRELTMGSELLDDTCIVCFQTKRYGRLLTAAEMGYEPEIDLDLFGTERVR